MVQRLPISRGQFALLDDEDFEAASAFNWGAKPVQRTKGGYYATRQETVDGRRRTVYLHRVVINAPDGVWVDHINGDGLDCRRSNLRLATRAENSFNRRCDLPQSGYRGVYRHYSGWRVLIEADGLTIRVGALPAEAVAARVHDALAREFHGEFAVLNFPRKDEAA